MKRPGKDRTARPRARLVEGRQDWYRIKNAASPVAEVWIYDEIGYWGVTAGMFVDELQGISASEIMLHINSPGGDVFDGIAIKNALDAHHATVNVTVDGLAASIASVIAMAGETVTMAPNSEMMIHDASGLCIGNAADMQSMVDLLNRASDNIASVYQARAGGTVEEWRARMTAETWMSAAEAVALGLADKVATKTKDDTEEPAAKWDLSVFSYASRADAPAPTKTPEPPEPAPEPDLTALRAALKGAA